MLDLMLPDGSGLDLLRERRSGRAAVPVLLLTARDQVEDRVVGLDAGARTTCAPSSVATSSPLPHMR
ncbi:hypothetical protein DL1_18735 [Thioclava dalianensis]|uniref:Response regulatory domain-containing protein n=1 Tax=Thioclava dalianensis TaxID=1185766 RepID=A0A074TEY7_9RHOB|nr:hypothetical protein DL1_18735 [Thioclava dalianensis]